MKLKSKLIECIPAGTVKVTDSSLQSCWLKSLLPGQEPWMKSVPDCVLVALGSTDLDVVAPATPVEMNANAPPLVGVRVPSESNTATARGSAAWSCELTITEVSASIAVRRSAAVGELAMLPHTPPSVGW